MVNPWIEMKRERPFVLPIDAEQVRLFNEGKNDEQVLHTEVIPEPFQGKLDAKVILLSLNPGFSFADYDFHHKNPEFVNAAFSNLAHADAEYPFYLLNPKWNNAPGYKYWIDRLKPLIRILGLDIIAKEVGVIQWLGYHSKKADRIGGKKWICPSQDYAFELVQKAIARNTLIIISRSVRKWEESVPDLVNENYLTLSSTRNQIISDNNVIDKNGDNVRLRPIIERLTQ